MPVDRLPAAHAGALDLGLGTVRATVWFGCLAMTVSYLPFSAVNATLGAIARSTGASTGQLQWMSDAFAVTLAAAVLSAGVLGDLFGRRRIVLVGLMLTACGAAIGFAAGAATGIRAIALVWTGQAISGLGGGAVMSATLALITTAAADGVQRARFIAWWAVAVVFGLGGGPFLAGGVTALTTWRWLFAPITGSALAVAVSGALRSGTSYERHGRGLDLTGQFTGALTVATTISAVIAAGSSARLATIAVTAVVAALSLGAFVLAERRATTPVLDLRLFSSPGFLAAGVAAAAVLFAIGGGAFLLSLVFAREQLDGLAIATRLGFLFAGNAVASVAAGRLQAILGQRRIVLGGLAVAAVGSASLFTVSAGAGLGEFAWRLALLGAGCGAVMATTSTIAVQSVVRPLAGMAGAGNNALRQVGAALGPAVLGSVLAAGLRGSDPTVPLHIGAGILAAIFVLTALATGVLLPRTTANFHRPRPITHTKDTAMTTTTVPVDAPIGRVELTLTGRGEGRPVLMLHGGAGVQSVDPFADRLAAEQHLRVLTPTHPGFNGTPRPAELTTIRQLAGMYVALLDTLDLRDVLVVGNSIGGWIAAELALLSSPRVTGVSLVDAVGIQVPGHPVVDFFGLSFPQIAERSYFNPDAFRIDPSAMPPAAQAAMADNRAALKLYAGEPSMQDPGLHARLAAVDTPVLVIWGDSDRIADPDYGLAYTAAIPAARFELLPRTGHLPQLESPELLLTTLAGFAAQTTRAQAR